jgi:sRNA-binding protein
LCWSCRLEQQAAEEARRAQEGALVREKAEAAAREAKLRAEEEAAMEEQRRKREEKERRASFKAAAEAKWLKSPSTPASTPSKPTPGKLRPLVKESPHGTNPQSPN